MDHYGNLTEDEIIDAAMEEVLRQHDIESIALRVTVELLSLVTLVCIICDVLSCFVIFKFRRLRQNAIYKILANWFIFNAIFISTSPILARTFIDMEISHSISSEAKCMMGIFEIISFTGTLLCVILLTFHWYFQFYHPPISAKYNKSVIYLIGAMNVILIVGSIRGIISCANLVPDFESVLISIVTYIFFIMFMFVINIVHITKKNILCNNMGKNISYIVSNVYFLLHLSLTIIFLLFNIPVRSIYLLIAFLACSIVILICPLYFFLILYKHDKHFNIFTRHVVACRCAKYTGDELSDQSVHYTNNDQV